MELNSSLDNDFQQNDENEDDMVHEILGVVSYNKLDLPSRIQLLDSELIITFDYPENSDVSEISIPLIGILEIKLIPHSSCMNYGTDVNFEDPSMPAVLLVTYLRDLFNNSSTYTIYINAIRQDLLEMKDKIEVTRDILQRRLSFIGPELKPSKAPHGSGKKSIAPTFISQQFSLINGPSKILRQEQIDEIRLALPHIYRQTSWTCIFAASNDGFSLRSLLVASSQKEPLIMLILSKGGDKIGAYLSQGLPVVHGFSGTAACFVFRASPLIEVFPSSRKNSHYVAAGYDSLQIGASNNKASLFIDSNLKIGLSDPCETFNSPQLTKDNQFEIIDVEIWHIKKIIKK